MYCTTNGNHVDVLEDNGRIVRKLPAFGGPVESAYMNGNDKVAITYTVDGRYRYTELWDVSGKMIRRTRC